MRSKKGQFFISVLGAVLLVGGMLALVAYEVYLGILIARSDQESLQRLTVSIYAANTGLTILLVLATAVYAIFTFGILRSTKKQAEASVEMARATKQAVDEARRQRQDAFLPVLDIIELSASKNMASAIAVAFDQIPDELKCKLKNVGVGPALHVQYQSRGPDGIISVLTENSLTQGCEFTPPGGLAIVSSANPPYISVTYHDVFGRKFTSTKVSIP